MRWYVETTQEPRLYCEAVFTDENTTVTYNKGTVGADSPDDTRTESYPSADQALEEAGDWLRATLTEGFVLCYPPDERFQQDPVVAAWWAKDFPKMLADKKRKTATDYADRMREYHPEAMAPELSQFLDIRSTHDFGYTNFGEWRMWDDDEWLPDPEKGNLFEQLVELDQANYLGTALLEYFVDAIFAGTAGNGDVYLAHTNTMDPGQVEVAFWDHETQSIDSVITDSLSTLAWANHMYTELDSEAFDSAEISEGMARIENRANLSWHYSSVEEESEIETSYQEKSRVRYFYYRCYWILYLLKQNRVVSVEDAGEMFHESYHAPLKFEHAVDSPYLRNSNVTALYWLWRLWWFDKSDDLKRCIEVTKDHLSPIVRDATTLVEELQNGRKNLGKIEDMHALRERWLALDLDPDRAEARAAEQAQAEIDAENQRLEDTVFADELIRGKSVEQLVEAAWAHIGNTTIIEAIYDALGEQGDDDIDQSLARWEFLTTGASSRDNRSYRFEDDECREALARSEGGAALVPRMLTAEGHQWFEVAAQLEGSKVTSILKPILSEGNEYKHRECAAVRGLVAAGAAELVPEFFQLLDATIWDADDYMSRITNKDLCWALIDAIGALGSNGDALKLAALLDDETTPKELTARLMVNAGRAGDEGVVPSLAKHLDGPDARACIYALSQAGGKEARAVLQAHFAKEDLSGPETAFEQVMLQRVLFSCGEAIDFDVVEKAMLVIESKKYEDIELHMSLIELLSTDWDTYGDAIHRYTDHNYARVRNAAIQAGEIADQGWTHFYADRAMVEHFCKDEPFEYIEDWVSDEDMRFRHNVLRKAADEGGFEDYLDEAIEFVEERLCYFTHYTNPYAQDKPDITGYAIEALGNIGGDAVYECLARLSTHACTLYKQFDYLKYDRDDIQAKIAPFVEAITSEQVAEDAEPLNVDVTPLAQTPWLFGAKINGMAWSPNGTMLAVAGAGGVTLMNADGLTHTQCADVRNGYVYDVDFHPAGNVLAMGAHAGHLHIIGAQTGDTIHKLKGHSGVPSGVRKVRFSPDGSKLATVSDDQTLRIWDTSDLQSECPCLVVFEDKADVNTVDWISEDRLVIATDRIARLLTVEGESLATVDTGGVAEVRVNPARDRIYVGAASIRVFDTDLNEIEDAALKQDNVARMRFTPDGKQLYAASWSGSSTGVWRWDLDKGKRRGCKGHDDASVFGMDLNPATGEIYAGGDKSFVHRWDAKNKLIESDAKFHTGEVGAAIAASDGTIFTVSDDRTALRWNADGDVVQVYEGGFMMTGAALSDDEATLFVSGFDHVVAFDVATGEKKWDAETKRSEGLSVFGDQVVAASYNWLVWLDAATGKELHRSDAFADSFMFRWMKLDDRRIAVAGYDDDRFFVWDAIKRELLATYELPAGERDGVCNESFGGGRIWASRWDKSVAVLDADSGELVKRLRLSGTYYPIAANPSGTRFVLTSGTKGVLYDAQSYARLGDFEHPGGLESLAFINDDIALGGSKSGQVYRFDFTGL